VIRRVGAGLCLSLAVLLAFSTPTSAKILKTRQASQSQALEITVGSGVEYETDSEQTELGFPFLFEWRPLSRLQLSLEPQYTTIQSKIGESAKGLGDFETSLTWDFVTERRYRPLFSAIALIKWPTAKSDIGTTKMDYTLGGIVSKDFGNCDLEFNVGYTWVGSPPEEQLKNSLELSLASEWQMTPRLALEAEIATATGGVRGQGGSLGGVGAGTGGGGGRESEATIGLAELITHRFKLEEGVVVKASGGWQLVFAWEFDFGEGR
jgi:hypothetical protein